MHTTQILLRSLAGVLVLNLSLLAADEEQSRDTSGKQGGVSAVIPAGDQTPQLRLADANKIIGSTLQNLNQDKYGRIENLILNSGRDRACYAVVSLKPITGSDDKLCAIPWTLLDPKGNEQVVVIDLPKEKLSSAPSFAADKYPALDNRDWWSQVDRHFGQEDKMKAAAQHDKVMHERMSRSTISPAPPLEAAEVKPTEPRASEVAGSTGGSQWGRLVSELKGLKVETTTGDKLGEVTKYMFDLPTGRLTYAIVSFGGVLGVAGDEAAVPWSVITVRPTDKVARAQTDRETLKAIAFKAGESSDNLSDRAYAERIYNQFHQEPYWEVFGYVGSADDARFDANSIKTIEGTLENVTTFQPTSAGKTCQELHLRDAKGGMVCVRLAPQDVVQAHGFKFENGDKAKATGSLSTVGDRSILIATEIQKGDQTLQLRDSQGNELWRNPAQQR